MADRRELVLTSARLRRARFFAKNKSNLNYHKKWFVLGCYWWRYGDSNPRPIRCERIALPTVLYPRMGVDAKGNAPARFLVGTAELESATFCMSSKRSNQLSYAPAYTCSAFVLYQHFYVFASIYSIIFRQLIVFAYAEYVNTARLAEGITVKRFIQCVVSVRRNKYSPAGKPDDDGRVVKIFRGGAELYDIADFQFIKRSFFRKGTKSFVAGQKVIKLSLIHI